jgi:hypothetical protein
MLKRGDEAIVTGKSRGWVHFFEKGTRVLILDNGFTPEDTTITYYNCRDVEGDLEQTVISTDLEPIEVAEKNE